MAPLATVNNRTYDYTEKDAFDALYQELAKGVQSMKNGEVYTIEEAWRNSTRYSIWINLKNIKLSWRRTLCKILKIRSLIYCRLLGTGNTQRISPGK